MTTRQEALDILVKLEEQMKSHGWGYFCHRGESQLAALRDYIENGEEPEGGWNYNEVPEE